MSSHPTSELTSDDQTLLLKLARQSIEHGLHYRRALEVNPRHYAPLMRELRALFVTLRRDRQLRGCIGTLEADKPLVANVALYAYLSAFSDNRFPELTWEEFPDLDIQISILSPTAPIAFTSEEDLLNQIRPGVDGLVLAAEGHRGTFLPSVWESIADKHEFWRQLKRKAGLPLDYWSSSIRVSRYTASCFSGKG